MHSENSSLSTLLTESKYKLGKPIYSDFPILEYKTFKSLNSFLLRKRYYYKKKEK